MDKFSFEVFGLKVTQMGSKSGFLSLEISVHGTFLFFWIKLWQHMGLKLTLRIFRENSCSGVLGRKGAQNEVFKSWNKALIFVHKFPTT